MYSKYVLYLAECFRALNYLSLRTNSGGKRHPLWTEGGLMASLEVMESYWTSPTVTSLRKTKRNKKTVTDLICECVFICVCSHPGGLEVTDKCASGPINNWCRPNTCSHYPYLQRSAAGGRKQLETWRVRYSFITITISFPLMIITSHHLHFKPTKSQPDRTETDLLVLIFTEVTERPLKSSSAKTNTRQAHRPSQSTQTDAFYPACWQADQLLLMTSALIVERRHCGPVMEPLGYWNWWVVCAFS